MLSSNKSKAVNNMEQAKIAGYCRISVDEEMDRENTSIENQKAIIDDFCKKEIS